MAVTLKTDRRGLEIIDRARVNKDWTALALSWCEAAKVSLSTLKRFRERKAIQKDAFIAICRAVGVEDWQRVVATAEEDVSVLRRKYRQSKRVIAEEVLSNLDSLDARLDFVEQAFLNDPAEAQRQIEQINRMEISEPEDGQTYHSQTMCQREPKSVFSDVYRSHFDQVNNSSKNRSQSMFHRCSLRLEANVSIIQIMMEI